MIIIIMTSTWLLDLWDYSRGYVELGFDGLLYVSYIFNNWNFLFNKLNDVCDNFDNVLVLIW